MIPTPDWLLESIAKRLQLDPETNCWNWTGYITNYGYGQMVVGDQIKRQAHRVMYQLLVGPIPDGLVVDHVCRNRKCQNPAHMRLTTIGDNADFHRRKTHCKHGHPFSKENTWIEHAKDGSRYRHCKTCTMLRLRQFRKDHPGYDSRTRHAFK